MKEGTLYIAIFAKTLELIWQITMLILMITSSLIFHRHIDDKKSMAVLVVGVLADSLYIAHNQLLTNCRFHWKTRCFTIGESLYKLFDLLTCRFPWVQEKLCQRNCTFSHIVYEFGFSVTMFLCGGLLEFMRRKAIEDADWGEVELDNMDRTGTIMRLVAS